MRAAKKKAKEPVASYPLLALFSAGGKLIGFECWTVFGASPLKGVELDPGDRLYPTQDRAEKAQKKLGRGFYVAKHIVPVRGGKSVVRWAKP